MGLLSGIVKLGKFAYRTIKYGKQVGKTAKNGTTIHKKVIYNSKTATGNMVKTEKRVVDANGNVTKQIDRYAHYKNGSVFGRELNSTTRSYDVGVQSGNKYLKSGKVYERDWTGNKNILAEK